MFCTRPNEDECLHKWLTLFCLKTKSMAHSFTSWAQFSYLTGEADAVIILSKQGKWKIDGGDEGREARWLSLKAMCGYEAGGSSALLSLLFQWLLTSMNTHRRGSELWLSYRFLHSRVHFKQNDRYKKVTSCLDLLKYFLSSCQNMSNIVRILIPQCPGSWKRLCRQLVGEVRSLFWLEEMNRWRWTEGESLWCFPQVVLWRVFFIRLRKCWQGRVSLSNVLTSICFADLLKW